MFVASVYRLPSVQAGQAHTYVLPLIIALVISVSIILIFLAIFLYRRRRSSAGTSTALARHVEDAFSCPSEPTTSDQEKKGRSSQESGTSGCFSPRVSKEDIRHFTQEKSEGIIESQIDPLLPPPPACILPIARDCLQHYQTPTSPTSLLRVSPSPSPDVMMVYNSGDPSRSLVPEITFTDATLKRPERVGGTTSALSSISANVQGHLTVEPPYQVSPPSKTKSDRRPSRHLRFDSNKENVAPRVDLSYPHIDTGSNSSVIQSQSSSQPQPADEEQESWRKYASPEICSAADEIKQRFKEKMAIKAEDQRIPCDGERKLDTIEETRGNPSSCEHESSDWSLDSQDDPFVFDRFVTSALNL